jgi:molecular chaperone GrpE
VSLPDEAVPAEEVPPEPERVAGIEPDAEADAGETWSDADSAALAAGEMDAEVGAEPAGEQAALPDPMTVMATERDEYLLALQRTQADFENYRKRITRLQEEQSARASAALVSALLPVLDTLDLAQAHQGEAGSDSEDAKALNAARAMLLDLLAKQGLERLDESGVVFDPAVHDAVARTEVDDGDEGGEGGEVLVEEVMRSGYKWKGQVLRPAMVRVRG